MYNHFGSTFRAAGILDVWCQRFLQIINIVIDKNFDFETETFGLVVIKLFRMMI